MQRKHKNLFVIAVVFFLGLGIFLGILSPYKISYNFLSAANGLRTSGDSSIYLNQTGPHLGDYVNFTVTYPKTLDHYGIRIQVLCYQNGSLVYAEAGSYAQSFLLGGAMSLWYIGGGPASCVSDLYYWSYKGSQKFNWLVSTAFDALGKR